MIRVGKESRQNTQQVLKRAIDYFGPDGVGLEVTQNEASSVQLQGGGGYVAVRVTPLKEAGQKEAGMTDVEIESREWERDAQRFLEEI